MEDSDGYSKTPEYIINKEQEEKLKGRLFRQYRCIACRNFNEELRCDKKITVKPGWTYCGGFYPTQRYAPGFVGRWRWREDQ